MKDTVLYTDITLFDHITAESITVCRVTGKHSHLVIEKHNLVVLIEYTVGSLQMVGYMRLNEILEHFLAITILDNLLDKRILVERAIYGSPQGIYSRFVEERIGTMITANIENINEVCQLRVSCNHIKHRLVGIRSRLYAI